MGRLNEVQSQAVVDGILDGYKEYLKERQEKKESMRVSHGYAFTRGNHIDNAVAEHLVGLIDEEKVKTTSGGWEYMEFDFENGDRCFFIVKSGFRTRAVTKRGAKESNYLIEYAKINNPWIEQERLRQTQLKEDITMQLSAFSEEENIQMSRFEKLQEYNRFYLVIYETDIVTKMITQIEVVALDAETRELHQIQDLTPYIQTSDVIISEVEAEAIRGGQELVQNEEYGYTVPAVEKIGED